MEICKVKMICKEDNSQAIIAAQKGYSPALRHLARHHRISLGFINETFYIKKFKWLFKFGIQFGQFNTNVARQIWPILDWQWQNRYVHRTSIQ